MSDTTITLTLIGTDPSEPFARDAKSLACPNGVLVPIMLAEYAKGARAFMLSVPAPSEPTCTVAFLKATVLAMLQTNTPEGRLQVAMDAIREAEEAPTR
jgi:hypothetical protein